MPVSSLFLCVFFNDTATTEIYTLSLHDALPIFLPRWPVFCIRSNRCAGNRRKEDRKSTRLNSSHLVISYAVFCLKKQCNARPPTPPPLTSPQPCSPRRPFLFY